MIEPEIAFCDIHQLMDIEEDFLKYLVKTVLEKCSDELEFLDKFTGGGLLDKLNHLAVTGAARITHHDSAQGEGSLPVRAEVRRRHRQGA